MAEKQYAGQNTISHLLAKLKLLLGNKVDKKEGYGLSKNDLTDELKEKIEKAGESSFSGNFDDLKGIPTLDGTELKGTLSKKELGIASKEDVSTVERNITEKGYQTAEQVEETITSKGYKTEEEINALIEGKKYQTSEDVQGRITEATTDMATQSWVNSQITNLNKKTVVTSTEEMTDENTIYLIKNSGSGNNIYDEYIVYNGTPEKIGTTEVDLSGYVRDTELVEISNDWIDAQFIEE